MRISAPCAACGRCAIISPDGTLIRMANLFANVAQLGREEDLEACLDIVTRSAGQLMRYGGVEIAVGAPATLIAFDAGSRAEIVAGIVAPDIGFKDGRHTFLRPSARLIGPGRAGSRYATSLGSVTGRLDP